MPIFFYSVGGGNITKLNYKDWERFSFGPVLSSSTMVALLYLNQAYTLSMGCQFKGYRLIEQR